MDRFEQQARNLNFLARGQFPRLQSINHLDNLLQKRGEPVTPLGTPQLRLLTGHLLPRTDDLLFISGGNWWIAWTPRPHFSASWLWFWVPKARSRTRAVRIGPRSSGTGGLADSNGISLQIVRACTAYTRTGLICHGPSPGVAACAYNRPIPSGCDLVQEEDLSLRVEP
jgi:hypothetical protein